MLISLISRPHKQSGIWSKISLTSLESALPVNQRLAFSYIYIYENWNGNYGYVYITSNAVSKSHIVWNKYQTNHDLNDLATGGMKMTVDLCESA